MKATLAILAVFAASTLALPTDNPLSGRVAANNEVCSFGHYGNDVTNWETAKVNGCLGGGCYYDEI